MKYCTRCLYPANHPLRITFDSRGICSGCLVHEEKDQLDWAERFTKLQRLVDEHRGSGGKYDCIVPVSGGRDSHFILSTVKRLGLNPLLVSYNRHWNTLLGHCNLANLKKKFDCDTIEQIVDPAKVKRITRVTLKKMGSMYWHVLAGQTAFPVQIAVKFKIPLIIWGAHQGLDQVGMFSHTDEVQMTRKYRKEHDLMGLEAEDLLDLREGLSERDVLPYFYPSNREIADVGVLGIYLGNYLRWDSTAQHELMTREFGYHSAPQQRTFDTYNDVHCHHYSGLHDYVKFLKWGYGKATDHACRELRLGRLTRLEAIQEIETYQNVHPKDLDLFLRWMGMTSAEFYQAIAPFRDPRIWEARPSGEWRLLDSILNHKSDLESPLPRRAGNNAGHYRVTAPEALSAASLPYFLIHRGIVK